MRRLVIDTNIYIDWFNAGRHEDILFQHNFRSEPRSSVRTSVLSEPFKRSGHSSYGWSGESTGGSIFGARS
jgi:hypothetical protein